MKYLKTKRQLINERLGINESTVSVLGDEYIISNIKVPKSLINAFISKAKKEFAVDPTENFGRPIIADLLVSYVISTFLNIESLPVKAVMGEKDEVAATTEITPIDAGVAPIQAAAAPAAPIVDTTAPEGAVQFEGKTNESTNSEKVAEMFEMFNIVNFLIDEGYIEDDNFKMKDELTLEDINSGLEDENLSPFESMEEFDKFMEKTKNILAEHITEGLGKFFTGKNLVGKDEEFEARKADFTAKITAAETAVNAKPDAYVFDKAKLTAAAEENNYLGQLASQKSPNSPKIFYVYRPGKTGAAKIAGGLNTKGNTVGA